MSTPPLDVLVTSPGREGLTGTAPASLYAPVEEPGQVTIAPDGRPTEEQPAWRQDFPIDFPQDQYVARRDFVKFLVLTSLALTVGQFWIGARKWLRGREAEPVARAIDGAAAVPVGATTTFAYPGEHDPCVLVRLGQNDWVAYGQKCTHLSCAVIPDPAGGVIRCPCHEGLFDLRTGNPIAGPPRRPLPRVRLEVRGGQVYATGVDFRTV